MSVKKWNLKNTVLTLFLLSLAFLGMACSSDESGGGGVLDSIMNQNTLENAVNTTSEETIPAYVLGRVVEEGTDKALNGVAITVEGYPTAYTPGDGYYRINGILLTDTTEVQSGKTFTLTAEKEGFLTHSQDILIRNSTEVKADVRLKRLYGTVSGSVRDASGPIANATIFFDDTILNTNSEGFYSVTNLPVGSVYIKIVIGTELKHAETRTISSGQQRLDFVLEDGGAQSGETAILSGVVTNKLTGAFLNNMLVTISGLPTVISGQDPTGSAPGGNANGYYYISGIPSGSRIITVIDPATPPEYYDYFKVVDLNSGSNISNVEMSQIPGGAVETGNVQGTVQDENGALVSGADITIYRKSTSSGTGAVGSPLGWYSVEDIPTGNWTITATHVTSGEYIGSVKVLEGTTEVNIVLAR